MATRLRIPALIPGGFIVESVARVCTAAGLLLAVTYRNQTLIRWVRTPAH